MRLQSALDVKAPEAGNEAEALQILQHQPQHRDTVRLAMLAL